MTGLYKAKSKKTGEWVEGFYTQLPKTSLGATIISGGDLCAEDVSDYIIQNFSKQHSNFSNSFPLEVVECEIYEIDPETLCQYIGKNDDNFEKIMEHDVISINTYDYMEPAEDFFGEVVYCEAWACWCIKQPDDEKPIPLCKCEGNYMTEIKIHGNIFDNPDLMEGAVD